MATPTTPNPAPLSSSLKIAILGAGIAGTTTALALAKQGFQDITIYESATKLGSVGAGINACPNLARVLGRLGVLDYLRERSVALEYYQVLDSETDEVLTRVDLSYLQRDYDVPFLVVHRKDLQGAILHGCHQHPSQITFKLGHAVSSIDYTPTSSGRTRFLVKKRKSTQSSSASASGGEAKLAPGDVEVVKEKEQAAGEKEGFMPKSTVREVREEAEEGEEEWVEADVVIAGDGVRSVARRDMLKVHGEEDHIQDTGQAAYRILLTRDQVKHDPELLELIDGKTSYRWVGEKRHIIAYPIDNNTIFNISTAHPDTHFTSEPTSTWTSSSGKKSDLLDTFETFNPRVKKLLELVPEGTVLEWRLRVHLPLRGWVEGNVCLTGDAAHSTLPHLAQGAAQAVEDGAVLAVCLSKINDLNDVHKALKVYEAIRKPRAEFAVDQAAKNGKEMQLSGGADREERNRKFRAASSNEGGGGKNPDKQVDRELQDFLYGVDIAAETEKRWEELWGQV